MSCKPLGPLTVLDFGGNDAVSMAGRLFAQQGATVIVASKGRGSPWQQALDEGKVGSDLSEEQLIASADIILSDDTRPAHVNKTWVTVSHPPGATDQSVSAATNLAQLPVGAPRVVPFCIVSVLASRWAATAALASAVGVSRGKPPLQVSLNTTDVSLSASELSALFTLSPPPSWNTLQWAGSPFVGIYHGRCGSEFFFHCGQPSHLKAFLSLLKELGCVRTLVRLQGLVTPEVLGNPMEVPSVRQAKSIRLALEDLFADRESSQWESLLSAEGLCAIVCRDNGQWTHHEQPTGNGDLSWRSDHHLRLGPPFSFDIQAGTEAAEVVSSETSSPLGGITVLDISQVIAGPFASQVLALFGATVKRVHNPHLDAPWVLPFHLAFNQGKQVRALDLKSDLADAERWAFDATLMIHNLMSGVPGFSFVPIKTQITAFGKNGPFSEFRGWEQTAQAATGMQNRWGEGQAELFPAAVTDMGTGLAAAFASLCGLYHHLRSDKRCYANVGLAATALAFQEREWHSSEELEQRWLRALDGWIFVGGERSVMVKLFGCEPELWGVLFRRKRVKHWMRKCEASQITCHRRRSLKVVGAHLLERATYKGVGDFSLFRAPISARGLTALAPAQSLGDLKPRNRLGWTLKQIKWAVYQGWLRRRA